METPRPILAQEPFFLGMPQYILDLLEGCAFDVHFDAGTLIFREGGAANTFYLIREGRVALETYAPNRGLVTIETIEAGEALGWSWLFPPYLWHFAARVVEPVSAIAFDAVCLRAQCEAYHDLGYELMRRISAVIIQRLQATRLRLLDVYGLPAAAAPMAGGRA